jgi:hypothetical protein
MICFLNNFKNLKLDFDLKGFLAVNLILWEKSILIKKKFHYGIN